MFEVNLKTLLVKKLYMLYSLPCVRVLLLQVSQTGKRLYEMLQEFVRRMRKLFAPKGVSPFFQRTLFGHVSQGIMRFFEEYLLRCVLINSRVFEKHWAREGVSFLYTDHERHHEALIKHWARDASWDSSRSTRWGAFFLICGCFCVSKSLTIVRFAVRIIYSLSVSRFKEILFKPASHHNLFCLTFDWPIQENSNGYHSTQIQ